MQPSHLVRELIASGMDPAIILAIAQENLRNLRDIMNGLPALQESQDGLLQQSSEMKASKKWNQAVREVYSVSESVRDAPRMIAELEIDIQFLTKYLEGHEDHDHQQSPSTH
ncbi:MAG: hypothetical protein Q9182_004023 [Xanthomendoza sp. 2 TL-2023]